MTQAGLIEGVLWTRISVNFFCLPCLSFRLQHLRACRRVPRVKPRLTTVKEDRLLAEDDRRAAAKAQQPTRRALMRPTAKADANMPKQPSVERVAAGPVENGNTSNNNNDSSREDGAGVAAGSDDVASIIDAEAPCSAREEDKCFSEADIAAIWEAAHGMTTQAGFLCSIVLTLRGYGRLAPRVQMWKDLATYNSPRELVKEELPPEF